MSRRNNNINNNNPLATNNASAVRRTYAQLQVDTQKQQQAAAAGLAAAVRELVQYCREPERRGEALELEIRFGVVQRTFTSSMQYDPLLAPGGALTQSDYERVARAATQRGWTSTKPEGETLLRISETRQQQQEEEGRGEEGALRAEIVGAAAIEVFCRHESLDAVLEHPAVVAARRQDTVFFLRKRQLARHQFTDLEFRASLARETRVDADADAEARAMRTRWSHAPKHFRHMNRAQFVAPGGDCVLLDLSIVHSNRRDLASGGPAGRGSAAAAGLFGPGARIEYEVELEVNVDVVRGWVLKRGDAAADEAVAQRVLASLHRAIRTVAGALQLGSNFPVGRLERNVVLVEYMQALYAASDSSSSSSVMPAKTFFVGPSPIALHRRHCVVPAGEVVAATSDGGPVTILDNYCVTDKADGERALLFVSASGSVYMISGALQVQFTGMKCTDAACRHLLLDGEYITLGHKGPLNLFAAFDLYVARDELQMGLPFDDLQMVQQQMQYNTPAGASEAELPPYRRRRMDYYTARLAASIEPKFPPSTGADATCKLSVRSKEFHLGNSSSSSSSTSSSSSSIFTQSKRVLDALHDYHTDGLVFTPTDTAVGGETPVFQRGAAPSEQDVRSALRNYRLRGSKDTWKRCFKWKPAEQLTNDFLVAVVGGGSTGDAAAAAPLLLTNGDGQITRYRKLRLLAGYNSNQAQTNNQVVTRGTAFFNMLMDVAPAAPVTEADRSGLETLAESLQRGESEGGGGYKPRAFVPSTPFDPDAQFCCLPLGADGVLRAENGDPIENATIVEFRFAAPPRGRSTSWGWRPIKVRHDKTSDLRSGKTEFGNAFWVANDNWFAMHYPVTRNMISGLELIDASADADAVYYNSARDTTLGARVTNNLSDFHNKVVKRLLLRRICGADEQRGAQQQTQQARTLIDFAVGRAGDMMKWQNDCRLQFVLGLDISRDNIFNAHNGAINRAQQRDVDYQQRNGRGAQQLPLPRCIFLPADSSLPIRSGDGAAFAGTLDRGAHRIVRAIFGDEPAPPQTLSPRFERAAAGSATTEGGFDVGSIQFAIHYMWESPAKLHGLLRNVSECVRLGGLFAGTCFDGARLFDKLRAYQYAGADAKAGPAVVASGAAAAPHYRVLSRRQDSVGRVLLAVAKKYTAREFVAGPQSVGMCVSVYMESIDQALDEYLVHLDYLDALMDVYGFEPLSEAEMVALGFPASGEGGRRSFEKLFQMEVYNVKEGDARRKMAKEEEAPSREISFLNSLFVYRKKRSLAPERLDALHREYVLNAPAAAATVAAEDSNSGNKTKKRGAYDGRGWAEFTGKYVRVATV
jgi:hypothetical protein